MLALQVPQGHIDGRHRGDRHRRAAKIHRAAEHFLPQPLGFQRMLADEQFAQAAGDVMAEWRIDNGFDDLRRRVGLADPFQAVVGAHPHEHGVLAAGGLGLNAGDAKNLADQVGDFHRAKVVRLRA